MLIELFTLEGGVLVPTIHCYTLKSLKDIMDAYPEQEDYLKIYQYIYYKTSPDPKSNPFFNIADEDKDDMILKEVGMNISIDNPIIEKAIEFCDKLYDTPTKSAYRGMKAYVSRLGKFLEDAKLSTGRDGSIAQLNTAAEKYNDLRQSFKGIEKDYLEEIEQVRGQQFTAYDQR